MIVNIIALLETIFYLCSIPVHLSVVLDGARTGAGVSAFEWRVAQRKAEKGLASPSGSRDGEPDARRVLKVLQRTKIEYVELTGRAALGDAAATALFCGAIDALARCFRGRVKRMRVNVRPDFTTEVAALELRGMLRARSGQIILAVLKTIIKG